MNTNALSGEAAGMDGMFAMSLLKEWPAVTAAPDDGALVDQIMGALIATNRVRLVSPDESNIAAMKAVIDLVTEANEPIPILMPWGSKKPDNGTIDVAEVGALKTLIALQERVKRFYDPGIKLIIRVEDLSGDYLFREEGPDALKASEMYVEEFINLVDVMGLPFVELKLERDLMNEHVYIALADEMRPVFSRYLNETGAFGIVDDPSLKSYQQLERLGWKGFIPWEQRDFYITRYARAWPDMSAGGHIEKLAGYFASILARIKLRGYGSEQWGKRFINLSFAPPVPGTPPAFAERRLYYRTLPENMARTHIPPWRAHGFLQSSGDLVQIKLAPFGANPDLKPGIITFSRGSMHVDVRAEHRAAS